MNERTAGGEEVERCGARPDGDRYPIGAVPDEAVLAGCVRPKGHAGKKHRLTWATGLFDFGETETQHDAARPVMLSWARRFLSGCKTPWQPTAEELLDYVVAFAGEPPIGHGLEPVAKSDTTPQPKTTVYVEGEKGARPWPIRYAVTFDTERRDAAAAPEGASRVRVREAQIEALMPHIDIRGPGDPRETLQRATERALDAVLDVVAGELPAVADAVSEALLPFFAEAMAPRTLPTRIRDAAAARVLALLWERGVLLAEDDEWPAVHYLRSSFREVGGLLEEVLAHEAADRRGGAGLCPDCAKRIEEAQEFVRRSLADTALGMEQPALPDRTMADGGQPDLVSRMIDAAECLRTTPALRSLAGEDARGVAGALRWLREGIDEGMAQRERYRALRTLVEGEPHVCTCDRTGDPSGDEPFCDGCSEGFSGRCRFEKALRTLLGVEEDAGR